MSEQPTDCIKCPFWGLFGGTICCKEVERSYTEKQDNTERLAKHAMAEELKTLSTALDEFLGGEIRDGLINAFKLTLIVQASTLRALADRSIQDIWENKVRD